MVATARDDARALKFALPAGNLHRETFQARDCKYQTLPADSDINESVAFEFTG